MYELPKLNYKYDQLTRFISSDALILHHNKHHQAYVDKINSTIESNPDLINIPIEQLFKYADDNSDIIKKSIKNNGGGHYNHSLFWKCISPNGGNEPTGDVLRLIVDKFGSFQGFVDEFTTKSLGVFGSGWVWLQPNGDIITTPNQDNPLIQGLDSPLLCLDVWEHAYYIDYKNRRDEYIKAWWSVIDWDSVSDRYSKYLKIV